MLWKRHGMKLMVLLVKVKNNQCKFKDDCGNSITDPQENCNTFKYFFVNVLPKLASGIQNTGKNYYDYLPDMRSNSMHIKPIVATDIIKKIDKFNSNKSAGHDNVGNYIIKKVGKEIIKPLTDIFNLSPSTDIVPDKLKTAKVIPIYKKADSAMFSNNRPVSLLSCFSKILERLVFDRCVNFINNQEILNDKQYDFWPKHSTNMAIAQLVDRITNAVEKKMKLQLEYF